MTIEVKVPNIGDFKAIEIIEIPVKAGVSVRQDETILVLESDKATMDIPSPAAGVVKAIQVKVGDKVGEGHIILLLDESQADVTQPVKKPVEAPLPIQAPIVSAAPVLMGSGDLQVDLVVLGSGPGGYTAAFHAADLGLKVALVERYPSIGGVCLNVGCIPSKALLHAAKVMNESKEAHEFGIEFGPPKIDLKKLSDWKDKVVGQLTGGLTGLAKQRKVEIVHGTGKFISPNQFSVEGAEGVKTISFTKAIIAAGSQPVKLPFLPDDPRIIDSTGALKLENIPKRMLVLGGGIIGLEMATVYHELGSKVTVVEMMNRLIAAADPDIVKPLQKRISGQYENITSVQKSLPSRPRKKVLLSVSRARRHPGPTHLIACW